MCCVWQVVKTRQTLLIILYLCNSALRTLDSKLLSMRFVVIRLIWAPYKLICSCICISLGTGQSVTESRDIRTLFVQWKYTRSILHSVTVIIFLMATEFRELLCKNNMEAKRDVRFPSRCNWNLHPSGVLRSVQRQLQTFRNVGHKLLIDCA